MANRAEDFTLGAPIAWMESHVSFVKPSTPILPWKWKSELFLFNLNQNMGLLLVLQLPVGLSFRVQAIVLLLTAHYLFSSFPTYHCPRKDTNYSPRKKFPSQVEGMASRTSTGDPWRYQQFSALLTSVVQEWVLMLLLLLEGLLSYLVTTFAHLCKLQPPCPICTRLDHVLGKAQPGFYRELMCSSHKAEASSWAFCHIHKKLVDVHRMCEGCLLSFAADKKSNIETYRSLVGKLGVSVDNVGCRNNFTRNDDRVLMRSIMLHTVSWRPLTLNQSPGSLVVMLEVFSRMTKIIWRKVLYWTIL